MMKFFGVECYVMCITLYTGINWLYVVIRYIEYTYIHMNVENDDVNDVEIESRKRGKRRIFSKKNSDI